MLQVERDPTEHVRLTPSNPHHSLLCKYLQEPESYYLCIKFHCLSEEQVSNFVFVI